MIVGLEDHPFPVRQPPAATPVDLRSMEFTNLFGRYYTQQEGNFRDRHFRSVSSSCLKDGTEDKVQVPLRNHLSCPSPRGIERDVIRLWDIRAAILTQGKDSHNIETRRQHTNTLTGFPMSQRVRHEASPHHCSYCLSYGVNEMLYVTCYELGSLRLKLARTSWVPLAGL